MSSMAPPRPTVVVVTGLSGAGKTTALHTLEDLGFFCVDNLPTILAPHAVKLCEEGGMSRVALGMDVRVRSFLGSIGRVLGELADPSVSLEPPGDRPTLFQPPSPTREVHVLFLDAADETLLRRFSESRRPHPLSATGEAHATAVLDGIRIERERLASLRARATVVLDTTHLSVHELRRAIIAQLGPASDSAPRMLTRVLSFGFKYGTPVDADLVLDVRFLDNPYFVPELKQLPGTDPKVRAYVLGNPEAQGFLERAESLVAFMLPKYAREGKSYLTLALGCTGGRHRSVVLAEEIAKRLHAGPGHPMIAVAHRDVVRGDGGKYVQHAERAAGSIAPTAMAANAAADADVPAAPPSDTELKGVAAPPSRAVIEGIEGVGVGDASGRTP